MSVDPATHATATSTRGVHYLPGGAVAVVAPDSVLLISGGHEDVAGLHERVRAAGDARAVLAAAAGGRVLDLDALPDLALAHRGPAGLRVLLSGRTRCTVTGDGSVTELDGADVALLGEWGFPADATVELSVHDAAGGEPAWPVTAGVVPADRVRWVVAPGESTGSPAVGSSSSLSGGLPAPTAPVPAASAPTAPVSAAPAPPAAPAPAVAEPLPAAAPLGADATLPPEDTAAPTGDDRDDGEFDDGEFDDVEYTIGGGINYDRVFNPAHEQVLTPHPTPPPAVAPEPASPPAPAPASPPAPAGVAPDLGGDTVPPEAVAALRDGLTGTGADPADEPGTDTPATTETAARLCPQNHANPPQLSACRLCRAPLDGPTVRIARPSLGVVRLSTGMFFDLDRPLLLGREPRIDGVDADSAPRLIVLPSPDKAISRSHLRVDIDGWSVHAVDLGSVNGTYLRRGTADEVRLMPDEPKMLMSGDILVVDDVRIRFEDLP